MIIYVKEYLSAVVHLKRIYLKRKKKKKIMNILEKGERPKKNGNFKFLWFTLFAKV